eukprot:GGOE01020587.1.p1 GENE.GGOE01020587.1~~GGOE01020587.1.p1  ORF type:complete len:797 (-),score=233.90 GGOE01020587.1:286-2676(-)
MPAAPPPANEAERLEVLRRTELLDSPVESLFDQLVDLAIAMTHFSMAAVGLMDEKRLWFKAKRGMHVHQIPRDKTLCSHVVHSGAPLVCLDTLYDPRTYDNPLVLTTPFIRSYLGAPICLPGTELVMGTVCVMDPKPLDEVDDGKVKVIETLARQAADIIHLRLQYTQRRERTLAFVAHRLRDIQCPLAIATARLAQLSNALKGNTAVTAWVEETEASVLLGVRTMEDLQDCANLLSGKVELHENPFQLRDCIEDVLTAVLPSSRGHTRVDLGYELAQDVEIRADVRRLKQVLQHLLSNALRHTSRGFVRLSAKLEQTGTLPAGWEKIRFEVRDTGSGIPSAKVPELFKAFGEPTSPTTSSGTPQGGVGLALCKTLCGAMGGSIWLECSNQEGATFCFTIRVPAQRSRVPDDFLKKEVLIIDPSLFSRSLLLKHCQSLGLQVSFAPTLREAETVIHKHPGTFDAVLCTALAVEKAGSAPSFDSPWVLVGASSKPATPEHSRPPALLSTPILQKDLRRCLHSLWGLPTRKPSPPKVDASGLNILVVDDSKVNRTVMVGLLQRLGCEPDTAADGSQAVVAAKLKSYDLIFMDSEMPVMNGLEATRILKRLSPSPFIVVATASSTRAVQEEFLEAGTDSLMEKPVQFDTICKKLELYQLSLHRTPPQAATLSKPQDCYTANSPKQSALHYPFSPQDPAPLRAPRRSFFRESSTSSPPAEPSPTASDGGQAKRKAPNLRFITNAAPAHTESNSPLTVGPPAMALGMRGQSTLVLRESAGSASVEWPQDFFTTMNWESSDH